MGWIKIFTDGDQTRMQGVADVAFLENARELITEVIENKQEKEGQQNDNDGTTIH